MDSHHSNETNFDLFVPESRTLTNLLLMQTSQDPRQLKLGLWMLNADKGLVRSIKSSKINNIENQNIRCIPNLHSFVSFGFGYSIHYI